MSVTIGQLLPLECSCGHTAKHAMADNVNYSLRSSDCIGQSHYCRAGSESLRPEFAQEIGASGSANQSIDQVPFAQIRPISPYPFFLAYLASFYFLVGWLVD